MPATGRVRVLGLDPGLGATGWGVIDVDGDHLHHVADGVIRSSARLTLAERLVSLYDGLAGILARYAPKEAAVEETFVNRNAASALKLGQARAIALLAPARRGIPVGEYAANFVKKSVVGVGHADKTQVRAMMAILLPGAIMDSADAADALAVAVCHAHHRAGSRLWASAS